MYIFYTYSLFYIYIQLTKGRIRCFKKDPSGFQKPFHSLYNLSYYDPIIKQLISSILKERLIILSKIKWLNIFGKSSRFFQDKEQHSPYLLFYTLSS